MTHDMWHVLHDMWHMVEGKHSLKNSLKRFGIYDVLKIRRKRITEWLNQLINDDVVCRRALATPGLLIIFPIVLAQTNLVKHHKDVGHFLEVNTAW